MVLCIIVVEASKLEHHCKVKYKGPEPCSNFLASTIVLDSYGFMGLLPAEPARLQNSGFFLVLFYYSGSQKVGTWIEDGKC